MANFERSVSTFAAAARQVFLKWRVPDEIPVEHSTQIRNYAESSEMYANALLGLTPRKKGAQLVPNYAIALCGEIQYSRMSYVAFGIAIK